MNEFISHWAQANAAIAPKVFVVRAPQSDTVYTRAQFIELRDEVEERQEAVQDCLIAQVIARGEINLKKSALLTTLNLFNNMLDGYYQGTAFYAARPLVPTFGAGSDVFLRPMVDAKRLWAKINAGAAPEGITLPLVLTDGVTQAQFTAAIDALKVAYEEEQDKVQEVILARAKRKETQELAYVLMKSYREAAPGVLAGHPALIETMPRLTPLPGHTPVPVGATAVFQAPNASKVVYSESTDTMLERYELRGTVGEQYDDEDAVVIASHLPTDPREFITTFGLSQPGARIALKVYVILSTGNEAGSNSMLVDRPIPQV